LPDKKKLVLIVDDAPANLQVVHAILKDEFKIRVATSGPKALDLVKAEPKPDLILLALSCRRWTVMKSAEY
jgi:phosphoserine phosphatase RsbU/P